MLQIQENVSLKNLNTFGIEANAQYFVEISRAEEIEQLFSDPKWQRTDRLILGAGSNMLFIHDFNGLVISPNIRGIEHSTNQDEVLVEVGAGENWNELVDFCVDHGYAGMENLALIPGSVGASPVQNIGAYGVELKDIFYSCQVFDIAAGRFKIFTKADCQFGYRESIFKRRKGQYIITSVTYRLSSIPKLKLYYGAIEQELALRNITSPTIKDIARVVAHIRISKLPDPSYIGNAGSFFKNPVVNFAQFKVLAAQHPQVVNFPAENGQIKLAAGWLIEHCGWKGKVVGRTGIWKNQALVLVNQGGATGEEVYNLSVQIIDSVYKKFGIMLDHEVNLIG